MTSRFTARGAPLASENEKDDTTDAAGNSITAPAVPASVIIKLLGFTLAMVTVPLGTYFATLHSIFKANSTYAGASAAVMANVVLIAYVVVAMNEDQSEQRAKEKKSS